MVRKSRVFFWNLNFYKLRNFLGCLVGVILERKTSGARVFFSWATKMVSPYWGGKWREREKKKKKKIWTKPSLCCCSKPPTLIGFCIFFFLFFKQTGFSLFLLWRFLFYSIFPWVFFFRFVLLNCYSFFSFSFFFLI